LVASELRDEADHLASELVPQLVRLQNQPKRELKIRLPSRARYWVFGADQLLVRSKGVVHVISNPDARPTSRLFREASEQELKMFLKYEAAFLREWLYWYERLGRPPRLEDVPDETELLAQVQEVGQRLLRIPGLRPRMLAGGPSGVGYRIETAGDGYRITADKCCVYNQTQKIRALLGPPTPGLLRFFLIDSSDLQTEFTEQAAPFAGVPYWRDRVKEERRKKREDS
jgi:hypothetical protein